MSAAGRAGAGVSWISTGVRPSDSGRRSGHRIRNCPPKLHFRNTSSRLSTFRPCLRAGEMSAVHGPPVPAGEDSHGVLRGQVSGSQDQEDGAQKLKLVRPLTQGEPAGSEGTPSRRSAPGHRSRSSPPGPTPNRLTAEHWGGGRELSGGFEASTPIAPRSGMRETRPPDQRFGVGPNSLRRGAVVTTGSTISLTQRERRSGLDVYRQPAAGHPLRVAGCHAPRKARG